MPQPLRKQVSSQFGPAALAQRPRLAVYIALTAAQRTEAEMRLGTLLATILGTAAEAAASMYLALVADTARWAALNAAGKAMLPKDLYTELDALLANVRAKARKRNEVIHGHWGIASAYPDALIRMDVDEFTASFADLGARAGSKMPSSGADKDDNNQQQMLYWEHDFIEIQRQLGAINQEIHMFLGKVLDLRFVKPSGPL